MNRYHLECLGSSSDCGADTAVVSSGSSFQSGSLGFAKYDSRNIDRPGRHSNAPNIAPRKSTVKELTHLAVPSPYPFQEAASYNPGNITIEDYFSHDPTTKPKSEIGRPKVMTAKLKTYKAHIWLCEDYPLSLKDQVLPIVELMAEYNPFFQKLEEFLTKKIPSGFPMRVEIPLYHILNACVTFGNLYGADAPAYGVICDRTAVNSSISSTSGEPLVEHLSQGAVHHKAEPTSCVVEDCVFDVGRGYHLVEEASPGHFGTIDEEEQLVQMAVQRSLVEYGGAEHLTQRQYSLAKRGVVEARPGEYVDPEEAMIQEAIAESFHQESGLSDLEQEYLKALELSREELVQEEERRKREDEELERVLKLSLVEN
nr:hypothetical transcript [Hymenolepis microstoma]